MTAAPTALDTPAEVRVMMVERWRRMTPTEKLSQVAELNHATDQLAAAGVRYRHPAADERDVALRVIALRLGRDDMVRAFDWDPIVEGW